MKDAVFFAFYIVSILTNDVNDDKGVEFGEDADDEDDN